MGQDDFIEVPFEDSLQRLARLVEKDHLPNEFVAPNQDLIEDPCPGCRRPISEEPVKIEVRPLSFDSRAYVGVCLREGRSRRGDMNMVIGAWGNDLGHVAKS